MLDGRLIILDGLACFGWFGLFWMVWLIGMVGVVWRGRLLTVGGCEEREGRTVAQVQSLECSVGTSRCWHEAVGAGTQQLVRAQGSAGTQQLVRA